MRYFQSRGSQGLQGSDWALGPRGHLAKIVKIASLACACGCSFSEQFQPQHIGRIYTMVLSMLYPQPEHRQLAVKNLSTQCGLLFSKQITLYICEGHDVMFNGLN